MVSGSDEAHPHLARKMRLRFRNFPGDERIGTRRNGGFEIALSPPSAPAHTADRARCRAIYRFGLHQRHRAAQRVGHMVRQRLPVRKCSGRHTTQILLAKPCVGHQPQHAAQLGVVAPFGVGIQRQVVGIQVDVVRQQQLQALLHPARHTAVLPTPEQAVVHKNGISAGGNGCLDQRTAGGHATHDARDLGLAFNLQAVGAIVLEALGLQQAVKSLQEFSA
ncbi:hypothetical protein D3C72_1477180 [compost metagenome]